MHLIVIFNVYPSRISLHLTNNAPFITSVANLIFACFVIFLMKILHAGSPRVRYDKPFCPALVFSRSAQTCFGATGTPPCVTHPFVHGTIQLRLMSVNYRKRSPLPFAWPETRYSV